MKRLTWLIINVALDIFWGVVLYKININALWLLPFVIVVIALFTFVFLSKGGRND